MELKILPPTPLVTVITSTTGCALLEKCLTSVQNQTHPKVQHLVIADGKETHIKVTQAVSNVVNKREICSEIDVIYLPYATGKDRWNGHRNLAAGVYFAQGDYICFLDDDNTMDPDHIRSCLTELQTSNSHWVYSLRKIVDKEHNYLCNDDCESLGNWASVLSPHDFFVDMNCYFLPKSLALAIGPVMHRKFREPGQMEVDRAMVYTLKQLGTIFKGTGKYTINYAVGGSALSVAPEFFVQGNKKMAEAYPDGFPWRKSESSCY